MTSVYDFLFIVFELWIILRSNHFDVRNIKNLLFGYKLMEKINLEIL